MINEATDILRGRHDLSEAQMQRCMEEIMSGNAQTPEIISFLTALSVKGETIGEITAAARIMRSYATKVTVAHPIILDTCGTGADQKGTFNISTAVAFVASGAGAVVAKHGNRSVSSACGSADILEALGVCIQMSAVKVAECLNRIGIAFLFAQNFHPAMKYAMPARKSIGKRTIFNLLGPLSNPAGANVQLVGVFEERLTTVFAEVLGRLGSLHAVVVHSQDGLDEITTTASTSVAEYNNGKVSCYEISALDFGIAKAEISDLQGKDPAVNARIMEEVLGGKKG
ncbi:MAG: anthranilate phosphoribosyltransferase, partial [Candidatus Omnitrophica bacterium]|nr:anthranilate phosphoribosyltransferase [Candidatus Omnitrophota bacterium]